MTRLRPALAWLRNEEVARLEMMASPSLAWRHAHPAYGLFEPKLGWPTPRQEAVVWGFRNGTRIRFESHPVVNPDPLVEGD